MLVAVFQHSLEPVRQPHRAHPAPGAASSGSDQPLDAVEGIGGLDLGSRLETVFPAAQVVSLSEKGCKASPCRQQMI